MKVILKSFWMMLCFIRKDRMLTVVLLTPVLAGISIKLGIPELERVLSEKLSVSQLLVPYYGLFDLFLAIIAPVLFCFVSAMVILEERDEHITAYHFITPLGRNGYLAARLGVPAAVSFLATAALFPVFMMKRFTPAWILLLAATGALQGTLTALLIVTISSNKLEGMAVAKLSTLMVLGCAVPYFLPAGLQLYFAVLPSFWMGKAVFEQQLWYLFPTAVTAVIWILILKKRFLKKMD